MTMMTKKNKKRSSISKRLPLAGVVVCLTGLPSDRKESIHRAVIDLGGRFTRDLHTAHTTHLIAEHARGDKYEAAIRCQRDNDNNDVNDDDATKKDNKTEKSIIKVVKPSWVEACQKAKEWVLEEPYLLIPTTTTTSSSSSTTERENNNNEGNDEITSRSQRLLKEDVKDGNEEKNSTTTRTNTMTTMLDPTRIDNLVDACDCVITNIPQSFLFAGLSFFFIGYDDDEIYYCFCNDNEDAGNEKLQQAKEHGQDEQDAEEDNSNNNKGNCGCGMSILSNKMAQLVRHGLGTRYWDINERITHLVISEEIYNNEEAREAVRFLRHHHPYGPEIISPRWIIASLYNNFLMSTIDYPPCPPPPPKLKPKARARKRSKDDERTTKAENSKGGPFPINSSNEDSSMTIMASKKQRTTTNTSTIFRGKIFCLIPPPLKKKGASLLRATSNNETTCVGGGEEEDDDDADESAPPLNHYDMDNLRKITQFHGGYLLNRKILDALRKEDMTRRLRKKSASSDTNTTPTTRRTCYVVTTGGFGFDLVSRNNNNNKNKKKRKKTKSSITTTANHRQGGNNNNNFEEEMVDDGYDNNNNVHNLNYNLSLLDPMLGELIDANLCDILPVTPLYIQVCISEEEASLSSSSLLSLPSPQDFPILFQPQSWAIRRIPSSVSTSCENNNTLQNNDEKKNHENKHNNNNTNNNMNGRIKVAITGFVGVERTAIIQLLHSIGATYTESLRKCNTHLICREGKGAKFERAVDWITSSAGGGAGGGGGRGMKVNMHVVSLDWLYHIMRYGYYDMTKKRTEEEGGDETIVPSLKGCEDRFTLIDKSSSLPQAQKSSSLSSSNNRGTIGYVKNDDRAMNLSNDLKSEEQMLSTGGEEKDERRVVHANKKTSSLSPSECGAQKSTKILPISSVDNDVEIELQTTNDNDQQQQQQQQVLTCPNEISSSTKMSKKDDKSHPSSSSLSSLMPPPPPPKHLQPGVTGRRSTSNYHEKKRITPIPSSSSSSLSGVAGTTSSSSIRATATSSLSVGPEHERRLLSSLHNIGAPPMMEQGGGVVNNNNSGMLMPSSSSRRRVRPLLQKRRKTRCNNTTTTNTNTTAMNNNTTSTRNKKNNKDNGNSLKEKLEKGENNNNDNNKNSYHHNSSVQVEKELTTHQPAPPAPHAPSQLGMREGSEVDEDIFRGGGRCDDEGEQSPQESQVVWFAERTQTTLLHR